MITANLRRRRMIRAIGEDSRHLQPGRCTRMCLVLSEDQRKHTRGPSRASPAGLHAAVLGEETRAVSELHLHGKHIVFHRSLVSWGIFREVMETEKMTPPSPFF